MTPSLSNLQDVVINALEDIKGQHILVFDAQPLTSMFDRVVIVSGTSNRQTRALAKNLHDKVKQAGGQVYGAEGEETGEWVLVDLGDIIVHIMQPSIREYYRLEEIWGKYPVDWQAEREAAAKKNAPRRKATAKKPITEKPEAPKKIIPKKSSGSIKVPSKKAAGKSAVNSTVAKKSGANKPAAKKPAAKKTKK